MNENQYEGSVISNPGLFNYIFSNTKIAEDLIQSVFDYLEIDETIKIKDVDTQKILPGENGRNIDYYDGLVFTLKNDNIVSLMVHNDFCEQAYKKCISDITAIYSSEIDEKEEDYQNCKKVYAINIVDSFKNIRNNDIRSSCDAMQDNKHKIIGNGKIIMIFIAADQVDNMSD